jgi:methionyl-tRNA formyltransferase
LFPLENTMLGIAARRKIPVVYIDKMNEDELAPLREINPDLILVGGFSVILKKPIIELPKIGCLNVHSALLPKHRGPNPFSAVILAGDTESGVTYHVIDPGIDTGDIIDQYAFPIEKNDDAMAVFRKSIILARKHIVEVLDRVEKEGLRGDPQDNSIATYDQKLLPEQCRLEWAKPAREIQRLMHAARPFLMPWFDWRGGRVYVTVVAVDPKPVDAEPGTVLQARPYVRVATGYGVITIVSAYSLKPIPWLWPSRMNRPEEGSKLE